MADYFISNSTDNGYAIGNNGNDGLSKATPFLTLDALNGLEGTATINGVIDADSGVNIQPSGDMELIPEVPDVSGITFGVGGGQNRAWLSTNGDTTVGALVLNVGLINNEIFYLGAGSGRTVTLNNPIVSGVIPGNGIAYNTGATQANIIVNGLRFSGASLTTNNDKVLYNNGGGANSTMVVNGINLDGLSSPNNNTRVVQASGLSTSGSAYAANITGTWIQTSTTGSPRIVDFDDCPGAIVEDCPAIMDAQSGSIPVSFHIRGTSTNAIIRRISGHIIGNNGIHCLIGEDGTANGSDDGLIEDITQMNVSTPAATTIHAAMIGGNTGGIVRRVIADNVQHGVIFKNQTGATGSSILVSGCKPTGNAVRLKGANNCTFNNYLLIAEAGSEGALERADDDVIVGGTGNKFTNGSLYAKVGATYGTNPMTALLDTISADWENCNYYDENGALGNNFSGGSFAAWQGQGYVSGATNDEPLFVDAANDNYHLTSASPLTAAGLLGSAVGQVDLDLIAYLDPPSIGPYQFVSGSAPTLTTPYSIGTNNGPLFTIKTSDTLATIEGAGFFDGNAAYASLLKTGDVILVEASNGTKLYNVTVEKISRTITLSAGTEIL